MIAFPQPEMIPTNGIELEVFTAGRPGRPVVLCHGFPEHAFSWRHQIDPLAAAGYHVIVPNQRGYGASSGPGETDAYDIEALTGDLVGLLDHYGYEDAVFVGHDWGAIVVWALPILHPSRVRALANLSVPYLQRRTTDWVAVWEAALGPDMYIVHFNRQPGVADAAFDANVERLLRGLYRTDQWLDGPREATLPPGMLLVNIAEGRVVPGGRLMLSEDELAVFVDAFGRSGFTNPINWYRNFTRNWHLLAPYDERVDVPALMIHGRYDMVPQSPTLGEVVADLELAVLDCGHWIQQERPEETNALLLDWLARKG